ncbi:MAG: hypothetical protein ABIH86_06575 [Planctomycetota bacterium]
MSHRSIRIAFVCLVVFSFANSLRSESSPLSDNNRFAAIQAGEKSTQANWMEPDLVDKGTRRWSPVSKDGKSAIQLVHGVSYLFVPFTKTPPTDGNVLVRLTYHKDSGPEFHVAIGQWASPTQTIKNEDAPGTKSKAWRESVAVFPASQLTGFVNPDDKTIKMMVSGDKTKGPILREIELYAISTTDSLTYYIDYVRRQTNDAVRIADTDASFTHTADYDTKAKLKPTADQRTLNAVPFVRSYLIPVYPQSIPKLDECVTESLVRMTPGEYEPAQIALVALKDLQGLNVAVSGLPDGLRVEPLWQESVPVRTGGGSSSKQWHWQPNRLWRTDIFPVCDVKKETAQAWWLIYQADSSLASGLYPTQVSVRDGKGKSVADFTVTVEILPFRLPETVDYAWGFYESRMVEEPIAADMAAHGCNSLSFWSDMVPFKNGAVDFTAFDAYFAMLARHRMNTSFFWYMGTKDSGFPVKRSVGDAGLLDIFKGLDERIKDGRYPSDFYVTIDEAVVNDKFAMLKELFETTLKPTPSIKRVGVCLNRHDYARRHIGLVEAITCNGSFAENAELCRQQNWKMYTYTVFSARSTAASARYNAGFNPWRYGAHGTFGWALRWANGEPFNDMDSSGSDWGILFPNWLGRPTSSPAWEAFREGVDDRRYIEAYASLVQAGKADAALLEKVSQQLAEDKLSNEEKVGDSVFEAVLLDAKKMQAARNLLIDAIRQAQ